MQKKRRFLSLAALFIRFYIIHACEKYNFVKEDGVELRDHVITTMTTPYVEICWDKCVWIMNCFSINVRVNSFGTFECDLNNSSKTANPGSLVPTQGSQYHYMTDSDVCIKHGCTIIKDALADGWYRYQSSIYKYFKEKLTNDIARERCSNLSAGADLVSLESESEMNFVNSLVLVELKSYASASEGDIWIGLNDRISEGTYTWFDGKPLQYTNWANEEPNDGGNIMNLNEDCVISFTKGKWNDVPCNFKYKYVCKASVSR